MCVNFQIIFLIFIMDTRLNFQEKSQKIIKFQKRIEIIHFSWQNKVVSFDQKRFYCLIIMQSYICLKIILLTSETASPQSQAQYCSGEFQLKEKGFYFDNSPNSNPRKGIFIVRCSNFALILCKTFKCSICNRCNCGF